MRKTVYLVLAAALLSVLSACNTLRGAGQDVQAGGAAIERAADK